MEFEAIFTRLFKRHVGREPLPEDGLPESAITRREDELRLKFPQSLRAYYRIAGNCRTLNEMHNIVYCLADLWIEDGHLIFMEENQAVVHWSFPLDKLSQPDPDVWQRVNCDPPEWYSEEMPFSKFMADMFAWQAGIEDEAE